MSNTLEQWQKAKKRSEILAYMIARAVAAGVTPWPNDIERFKQAEAEMRELETKFGEDS